MKNPPRNNVRIEHGYKISGQLQNKTAELDKPSGYSINCTTNPENIFIKISIPSQ